MTGSTGRARPGSCSRPRLAGRPSATASRVATVRVDRFELIRAMTGRRSVAQMEALQMGRPAAGRAPRARHLHARVRRTSSSSGWRSPAHSSPFRHRAYARFWFGAFVSNIGTWMETVGVGILVTKQTGQAGWAGLVAAAAFVPSAFARADRRRARRPVPPQAPPPHDHRVQTVLAGVLTTLAAVDHATPGLVTVIVFLSGCAGAIGFPSFQALLPDLVPPEELPAAIALGVGAVEPRARDRARARRHRDRARQLRSWRSRSTR